MHPSFTSFNSTPEFKSTYQNSLSIWKIWRNVIIFFCRWSIFWAMSLITNNPDFHFVRFLSIVPKWLSFLSLCVHQSNLNVWIFMHHLNIYSTKSNNNFTINCYLFSSHASTHSRSMFQCMTRLSLRHHLSHTNQHRVS